jgi:hypothetical protein
MNLIPSNLGTDPKKIAVLGGLVLVAAYFYFSNSNSGGGPAAPIVNRAPVATPGIGPRVARSTFRQVQQAGGSTKEFKPSLKPKNVDTASIDPTLRLDLLAKLKSVDAQGGARSLFEISATPPEEEGKAAVVKEPEKIAIAAKFVGPMIEKPAEPLPEPKAPPIPLKFYGFVNKTKVGDKRAFFLDGEDIVIAAEGDTIKKRYKIVRIGVNSAVLEDTEFKNNNQQTLPLEAELNG